MEVNCEGCAGCCIDWRALTETDIDHERRGPYEPLDDTYNLVPLSRDDVWDFLDAGYGDALTPRLWRTDAGTSVSVGGVELAAIAGNPAFFVGIRKPPKPVAPFGCDPKWLPSCTFLDPQTLQCRVHDGPEYPETCGEYPGENLTLDVETECERVEAAHGGERLLDDEPPEDVTPTFGPAALGSTVFAHPDPDRITDAVARACSGDLTRGDRAEFVAVAAGSSPGMLSVNTERYEQARERVLAAESWAGAAIRDWQERSSGSDPDPSLATTVEDDRGAPETPGWNEQ
ncbi:YkgJ family cysteine cluster protein [Haloarculaceae archaeon H-GB2-1]|nr:YkgJ family cysteine cluster protein [Haloarculaceae archaeon H-GB1-1]MEA5388991.1 YkgJ family cysteine cluster protein [Haloarculaceae archaeon H-GB11]MEA5407050.1 YkgJ family cysteine cluster protein [Haloarculaceae archaeon H-GB2-1]